MNPAGGRPRLRELDLLRFVAAVMVMLHHYVGRIAGWGVENHHAMPVLAPAAHFGGLGVDLFFLISGFVVLMSVWGRSPGDFAVSRVVRIFPGYWFGVTFALVLFLALGESPIASHSPLVAYLPNMTMLQEGVGAPNLEVVYWTLWAELHFYVLIALLVWRGVTYGRCVAFMVSWLLLAAFAEASRDAVASSLLMPGWAPYFIAGMAFFLVHRFGPNLLLWLIAGACWALAVHHRTTVVNAELRWPHLWESVVTGAVTFLFLLMAMVATHQFEMLRWRGLTVLGALTYPLYLVHESLGRALVELLGAHLGRWPLLGVCCAAALVSAYLVYRFVETPSQRWMRPRLKEALHRLRRDDSVSGRGRALPPSPAESSR
ncbi:acyltransferase family protein [Actinomadura sp. DSM 109109]|nr:acyltransferase family protein [Actinomadura lepetitiana]